MNPPPIFVLHELVEICIFSKLEILCALRVSQVCKRWRNTMITNTQSSEDIWRTISKNNNFPPFPNGTITWEQLVTTLKSDPKELYMRQERLNSGSCEYIYKAIERTTNRIVAVVTFQLDENEDPQIILKDYETWGKCDSPYIRKWFRIIFKDINVYSIMEYFDFGNAKELILRDETLGEIYISIIIREVLKGFEYLHKNDIIHGDLQAYSIMLSSSGEVKLNFGINQIELAHKKCVGSPYWMAPEVILSNELSPHSDIWSLGITAIELAKGEPPNASIHPMRAFFFIPQNPSPSLDGHFSDHFKNFVEQCLVWDPVQRPSASELLKHRFIENAKDISVLAELLKNNH